MQTNFGPKNHPLRTYLQSLNLDEETAVSTKEIPTDDTATPTKPLVNFHWLSQFINSQIEASKKGIFECILTSNHLVEDDYVILEHYCAMLPTKPSEASQLQPINLSLIALGVLVLAVSLCVTPISLAAAFLIGIFSLWVLLRLVALRVFVVLIKRIIADLKEFHESVKKSAHFLQGLTYSEWGLTFAAAGMNRRASASSVFPSFTRLLHKVTVDYLTQVSQLSRAASDVFHDASVVDAGGCLAEVSPEVTADAAADASLSSIKALSYPFP
ncbi:unnamed protein product [Mesocestoides corti]|uniref:Uncharacterized protein n=1 Tax=Mesocestoides corti TaxID=53468 RepID=A0A0R3U1N3_MESCO|nr:unnamed protein product [Mesocestoides corti]